MNLFGMKILPDNQLAISKAYILAEMPEPIRIGKAKFDWEEYSAPPPTSSP